MRPLLLLFLVYLVTKCYVAAQQPGDCIKALEVCQPDTLHLHYNNLKGSHTEHIANTCAISDYLEFNTLWLKYTFPESGRFLFTINPADSVADIDFAVFKSASGSCFDLSTIRCMVSGENIGAENDTVDTKCLGRTGLSLEATDTFESPGCQPGDDNFLAPVNVLAEEVIFVAITSYSPEIRYHLEHTSNTAFSCTTPNQLHVSKQKPYIYPNPAREYFTLGGQTESLFNSSITIRDLQGRIVLSETLSGQRINISSFLPGLYLVQHIDRNVPINLMLVIQAP